MEGAEGRERETEGTALRIYDILSPSLNFEFERKIIYKKNLVEFTNSLVHHECQVQSTSIDYIRIDY